MKRVLTLIAATALTASAVMAQTIVRISAYNPFVSTIVGHPELGPVDLSGAGPYPALQSGVLPGNQVGIYTLFLSVHPDQNWLTGGPNDSTRWSSLSFSITYDSNYIDFVFRARDGSDVFVSSLPVNSVFSPYIQENPPARGVAAGRLEARNGSNVTVTFALAATANVNGVRSSSGFNGYLRDWFRDLYPEPSSGEELPLRVRVNGPAIAGLPNQTYSVSPGIPEGNIIIQVNPADSSRNVIVDGRFIVPEPASMIALGSGLVGLLALRRRRSN